MSEGRLVMGAVIAIPLITIVLITVGYVLWTVYLVIVDTITVAKPSHPHGSGETAAHYDPTDPDHHHVSTTPPRGFGQAR
jgi:hypothetical protein